MMPRKTWVWRETVYADGKTTATRPVTRVAVAVAIGNPMVSRPSEDFPELALLGAELAERFLPDAIALLSRPAVAYGKAAIVGISGELEHAAAVLHPRLGKPMRALIGGGAALIPSTAKVAAMGSRIDVPLGHKDDAWSFDQLDTLTVGFDDGPRADEILVILALSDGGRPAPRIDTGRSAL